MSVHYSKYLKIPTYTQDYTADALHTILEVMSANSMKELIEELRVLARYVKFDAVTFEQLVKTSYYTDADIQRAKQEAAVAYYLSMKEKKD